MSWSSAIGSLVNGVSSLWSVPMSAMYERKSAQQAYERNLSSWMMQNEYNSPSEQMQRLKDAGLNPNLIYGSVNNSAGAVSSAPVARAPSIPNIDFVTAYQNLEQQDAMTQQVRAQTQLARAQAKALDMENSENEDAGTSRSTPYPIKVVKQAKEAVTPISESLGNTWSSLTYKLYPKWYNNVLDGFINVVGGKDFSSGQPGNYRKLMRRGYGR